MFGLSFSEFLVIGIVALVAVGPAKLPGMLRTLGDWIRKLRNLTYDIRAQSGIDEILRAEGLHGGVSELKTLIRSAQSPFVNIGLSATAPRPNTGATDSAMSAVNEPVLDPPAPRYEDPYANLDIDATREYPPEGPDAYGALPDDLFDDGTEPPPQPLDVLNAAQPLPVDAPSADGQPPEGASSAALDDMHPSASS